MAKGKYTFPTISAFKEAFLATHQLSEDIATGDEDKYSFWYIAEDNVSRTEVFNVNGEKVGKFDYDTMTYEGELFGHADSKDIDKDLKSKYKRKGKRPDSVPTMAKSGVVEESTYLLYNQLKKDVEKKLGKTPTKADLLAAAQAEVKNGNWSYSYLIDDYGLEEESIATDKIADAVKDVIGEVMAEVGLDTLVDDIEQEKEEDAEEPFIDIIEDDPDMFLDEDDEDDEDVSVIKLEEEANEDFLNKLHTQIKGYDTWPGEDNYEADEIACNYIEKLKNDKQFGLSIPEVIKGIEEAIAMGNIGDASEPGANGSYDKSKSQETRTKAPLIEASNEDEVIPSEELVEGDAEPTTLDELVEISAQNEIMIGDLVKDIKNHHAVIAKLLSFHDDADVELDSNNLDPDESLEEESISDEDFKLVADRINTMHQMLTQLKKSFSDQVELAEEELDEDTTAAEVLTTAAAINGTTKEEVSDDEYQDAKKQIEDLNK